MRKLLKLAIVFLVGAVFVFIFLFSSASDSKNILSWFYIPGIGNTVTTTTTTEDTGVFQIEESCAEDSDCVLMSINCCNENAGASWACVNGKETIIECPSVVFCPQYVSPKPNVNCICFQGVCSE